MERERRQRRPTQGVRVRTWRLADRSWAVMSFEHRARCRPSTSLQQSADVHAQAPRRLAQAFQLAICRPQSILARRQYAVWTRNIGMARDIPLLCVQDPLTNSTNKGCPTALDSRNRNPRLQHGSITYYPFTVSSQIHILQIRSYPKCDVETSLQAWQGSRKHLLEPVLLGMNILHRPFP